MSPSQYFSHVPGAGCIESTLPRLALVVECALDRNYSCGIPTATGRLSVDQPHTTSLLEEFLDSIVTVGALPDGTRVSMICFDRELSHQELLDVEELMRVGEGLA